MKTSSSKRRPTKARGTEVAVIGELFEEVEADIVKSLLDVAPGDSVTIYFDSAGGSVYSAVAIAELMRIRRLKATAVVLGECSSSALLIFAACRRRLVTPRSVFLFHRVRWRSEKDVRSDEAANWASHFQWLEEEIDRFQAELFGAPHARFADWIEKGRFLTGAELVEAGLAEFVDHE